MKRLGSLISLALSASLVVTFTYWYGGLQARAPASQTATVATASMEQTTGPKSGRKILYYRNPMGAPDTSPVPKKDPMMWGTGIGGLIALILLVLIIAALVKYVFFR